MVDLTKMLSCTEGVFMVNLSTGLRGLAFSLKGGVPNLLGSHKFLERKIGCHKIFDDQHVGSHKMTTDSVFICSKGLISIQF